MERDRLPLKMTMVAGWFLIPLADAFSHLLSINFFVTRYKSRDLCEKMLRTNWLLLEMANHVKRFSLVYYCTTLVSVMTISSGPGQGHCRYILPLSKNRMHNLVTHKILVSNCIKWLSHIDLKQLHHKKKRKKTCTQCWGIVSCYAWTSAILRTG